MEKWSEKAWAAAEFAYKQITNLAFLKELSDGTLPMEKFRFYISQDNQYIDVYSRVLAHIASRLTDIDDMDTFLRFAGDGVAVEKSLHSTFSPDVSKGKSMACEFYTAYLKAQACEDLAVEAAAVLPCFWVYQKVGEHIYKTAHLDGNPYREWILTYADPAFDASTKQAIAICDKLAAQATNEVRDKMTKAFVDCTRLEWMFWDSAYRMELWNAELTMPE